ncbi:prepilin-type N-terminal cleavage/methylation domain-containing protein [Pseudomonadota bacterium]
MKWNSSKRTHRGYTLIEVLIGILVFSLGMMALAKLQGNLARNSGDSNARTVATNIAEEIIESSRNFVQITSDGTKLAYNDIVDGTATITRAGNQYTVVTNVTDYYYDVVEDDFDTTAPSGIGKSDFKKIELTVTWSPADDGLEFQIDENTQTSGQLGSGRIQLTDVISSLPTIASGKVALGSTGDMSYSPPVDYNPGENPDIVSIELGANKFKESTTPLPDVVRTDELVQTTFDVVTYSQDNSGATFLRREEFRALSCECTLRLPDDSTQGGFRPTVWEGYEYTAAEFVSKPFGESANNQQSEFCDLCCRDHHDGGTGENDRGTDPGFSRYNPFRPPSDYYGEGALLGDHKHYSRDSNGNLVPVDSDGDTYVEACRMIRKDGFWRIAQDLRQEGLNSFPADYLDDESEVDVYSDYVTDAVDAFETAIGSSPTYPLGSPLMPKPSEMSPAYIFPASTSDNPTTFPTALGDTEQQLRARGIYIDYLSKTLRDRINCLEPGGDGEDCEDLPGVTSALEIIPFYDVQLTWLSRWNESPNNNPVDVTNEAIADDNSHSRGNAQLTSGFRDSTISSSVHPGNLGLTGTDPIDPWYSSDEETYYLYALAVDYSSPPPLSGDSVIGTITTSVPGFRAADVEIFGQDAQCDRTNTGFKCVIEATANNPYIKVTNYVKANKVLVACSEELQTREPYNENGRDWTRFRLPTGGNITVTIVIKENSCT